LLKGYIEESKRGEASLKNLLPLSFEGEGDKGGEVRNMGVEEIKYIKRNNPLQRGGCYQPALLTPGVV
jgi:hypothetical protein